MERYKLIKEVGDGTFGTVWRAINKQSGEVVAIKKMKKKYYSWEECVNLREVKSLRRLNHSNIVKLKEVIRENNIMYFVFEYMDCNLYQLMKEKGKPFSEVEVRNWCFQIFQALAYMHQRGYFHRDLKPENLLVTKDIIKVADFGLAREISSNPPFTEYVSTRWYRAPEVLLQSYVYGSAVDMWAMGAIIAELLTLHPLFPGSSEVDELHKICNVIGSPSRYSWAEGLLLADAIKFQFPQVDSVSLSDVIPSASKEATSLISSLCAWDPSKRLTAVETLQHPFFQPCFYIPPSFQMRTSIGVANTPPSAGTRDALELRTATRYSMGVLSNVKPASNFSTAKVNAAFRTGAQRKLEMGNQEAEKTEKFMKNHSTISRYQPPMKEKAGALGRDAQRVSDMTKKLAHFTLNSSRSPSVAQKLAHPEAATLVRQIVKQSPNMKAGSWRNHTDFTGRLGEIPTARSYSRRKVAG